MTERSSIYEWMHQYIMECLNSSHAIQEGWTEWKRLAFEMEQIRKTAWMAYDEGFEDEMILEIDNRMGRMMPPREYADLEKARSMLVMKKAEIEQAYGERKYEHDMWQEALSEPTDDQDDSDQDDEVPWRDDDEQDDSDQDYFIEEAAREIRAAYENTASQMVRANLDTIREISHSLTEQANSESIPWSTRKILDDAISGFYPRCYVACRGIYPIEAEEFTRYAIDTLKGERITDTDTCLTAASRYLYLADRLFDLLYRLASGR